MGSWSTQALLLLLTFGISIFWYATFLWRRRYWYIYSQKVPGPLSFPLIGSTYLFLGDFSIGGIMKVIMNVQETYHGLCKFWFGSHLMYFVTEPELIEKVLTNKNALHKNYLYDFISRGIGNGLLTAPVAKWRKHRKLILPSFNQKHLNAYVQVFSKHSIILSNTLSQYVGRNNFDTFLLFSRLTLDTTVENFCRIASSTQTTNSMFPKLLDRAFTIVAMRVFCIWLQLDIMFNLSSLRKEFDDIVQALRIIITTVLSSIRDPIKMNALRPGARNRKNGTIFYRLPLIEDKLTAGVQARKKQFELKKLLEAAEFVKVEAEIEEEMKSFTDKAIERSYFTEEDLEEELNLILLAANDTTAASLTFLFEILGLYQDVQQKVYEEVVEVVGKDSEVEASDLPKLKYTERVIQENLRLFPPVPMYFRKIGEDIDLGDFVLPKGSSVCVSPFVIHRKSTLWHDPLKFDPSRFLPEQVAKRHPCAYVPFSYGPRNCIGYRYGLLNLKTVLATLIRKYKFATGYKTLDDIKPKFGHFLRLEGGSKLSVSLREDL